MQSSVLAPRRRRTSASRRRTSASRRRTSAPRRVTPLAVAAVVAGLAGLLVAFALIAWHGQLPYGSDNDEYVMVARALRATGEPVVAGVEGTKYPIGYPLVLAAVEALGLPLAPVALGLNVALVVVLVGLTAALVRGVGSPVGTVAACAFVATNATVWSSVYSFMPDVAFTALVAAVLLATTRARTARGMVAVAALAAIATFVKSMGLLVALGATAGLLADRATRSRWALLPAGAAAVVVLAGAAFVAPYPEHATGYASTYLLENPYDAAAGQAALVDVGLRVVTEAETLARDLGRAVAGDHVGRWPGIGVGAVLVGLGIAGLRGGRWPAAGIVAVYGAGLATWPYASPRFGLAFLPLAAVGVAFAASWLTSGRRPVLRAAGIVIVVALLGAQAWAGGRALEERSRDEGRKLADLHAETADAVAWLEANAAGERVASLDYREIALRLGRPVLPMRYTSDTEELWAASGGRGARWFVAIPSLYPRRGAHAEALVDAYPDRFTLAYENDRVEIYRIES